MICIQYIFIILSTSFGGNFLPDTALLYRVHRGASRTAPVFGKFRHVGKGSINTEN